MALCYEDWNWDPQIVVAADKWLLTQVWLYLQKCRENVIVVKHELLDADSDHSADYGTHAKRGNENSGRNFDSKSENGDD